MYAIYAHTYSIALRRHLENRDHAYMRATSCIFILAGLLHSMANPCIITCILQMTSKVTWVHVPLETICILLDFFHVHQNTCRCMA